MCLKGYSISFTLGKASSAHGGNIEHNNRDFTSHTSLRILKMLFMSYSMRLLRNITINNLVLVDELKTIMNISEIANVKKFSMKPLFNSEVSMMLRAIVNEVRLQRKCLMII